MAQEGASCDSFGLPSDHSPFPGSVEHVFAIRKDTEFAQKSRVSFDVS